MRLHSRLWRDRLAWLATLAAVAVLVVGLDVPVRTQGTAAVAAAGQGGGRGRGGARGASPESDFAPREPYLPRRPADEAKGFMLPTGYRMELVASDPDVISPVIVEFDGNGRMYVAEMIGYMMDAEATNEHDPVSRISRWESTKGDGVYDKHTIFADHLVAPRMILPVEDGAILTSETDSDDLIKLTDTNGDGIADAREVVFTGIGQSGDPNIEHQKAGLVWGMDNWIYTTYNAFRIRWTPTGFLRESTGSNGGQWGLGMDDDGKMWFVDAGGERGPMNFQYPIHYGSFTPCAAPRGGFGRAQAAPPPAPNPNCPPDVENGFEKDFAVVWPAPGIADMQGGMNRIRMPARNLNHFTAATGPAIFRGTALPADLRGDLFFTEPVGRLVRRATIENVEGLTILHNAYPGSEFLISEDQLFRPVNISNAPDGTLYISDMYHGIIQERQWSGPGSYLRAKIEQYQLDKVASYGRIWRLRYDGRDAVPASDTNQGQEAIPAIEPRFTPPHMYSETPAQLVAHLSDANGWWRDMAQRLLVLKQDKSVVPALEGIVRDAGGDEAHLLARFHALWTLEGLGALDANLVRAALRDPNPRMRIQAARASETLYKGGDKSFADDYRALTKDADPNVAIQGMLSLSLFKVPDLEQVVKAADEASTARGVALVAERLLEPAPTANFGGGRGNVLTAADRALAEQGAQVFDAVCFSCHGNDGLGRALEGSTDGTMMAPPLGGSPRVQGHRDYVIKVLLNGLTGPIGDRTYHEVMVPMGAQTDAWVAGVATYVRNSFGNAAGPVSPEDVARVRKATASRTAMWTVPELEASLPVRIGSDQLTLSASHAAAEASNALTLRGWNSGEPQAKGMWFQIDLAEPAMVTEVQFDSAVQRGGGGGRRGGGFGAGRGAAPPPVVEAPRAFEVQVSTDGQTWSAPVASGTGDGQRTDVTFTPTRAKAIRITQTGSDAGAPNWSINNLRVYEAPAAQ